jgi:N-acyl-phosphatidylethanolamine-hydrolysing phospholipase D
MGLKLRTGIGIVVAYTGYSTYVQLRTSYEISERARKKLYESDLEHYQMAEWPANKFGSMMVAGRFVNPFTQYRPQTVFEFVYCRIAELFHVRPRGGVPSDPKVIARLLPTRQPDFDLMFRNIKEHVLGGRKSAMELSSLLGNKDPSEEDLPDVDNRMTLTWLGQSCAYVQVPGFNMITDPCFGEHLVNEYIGPKRISPAPCQLEDLPPVDVVLVSHDHPDHLELETAEKIGNNALWIVPMGVAKLLADKGITNVREMDWWDKIRLPGDETQGWEVACTPAMHWSGRKMIDSNSTLWCSFMVLRHGKPIFYHAGDTGYSPDLFRGIRQVFGGDCQVAMLPCGAYTPRWHLRPQHIDPYEALQVMRDLRAHKMVGVHWGTFVLSDEHFLEPRDRLHELAKRDHLENDVIAPEFGQTLVFRLDRTDYDRLSSRRLPIRDGYSLLLD